jgi:Icc-related predicted phosphoesterase
MRFYIFGHALYEKALQPYAAMTGKISVFLVDENFHLNQIDTQLSELDNLLSARLMHEIKTAKTFSPLPIMGVPGWCDANEVESFYDNKEIFRPVRKVL